MTGTAQRGTLHGHQTDGTDADDDDGMTETDIGEFRAVQTGGGHVAEHDGVFRSEPIRQESEVGVRVVHVENVGENAVFKVGEFPAGEHPARVHRESRLRALRAPVRSNRGHDDAVARLKIFDLRADFDDHADRFVA